MVGNTDEPDEAAQHLELPLGDAAAKKSDAKKKPATKRSNRRRANTKQGEDPGLELERRVARIEFAEGAFVRTRTPVRAPESEPGRRILTDVDVLSIDVDLRLRIGLGITECKSERGQSGEIDRLFWLAGLKMFLGANRATLSRATSSGRGIAMARALGLRMLDESTLARREQEHAWLPQRFGHIGGEPLRRAAATADRQLKSVAELSPQLLFFLQHESISVPPYRVLNALLSLRSRLEGGAVLPHPAQELLCSHCLVALVLAALRDAGTLDAVPVEELKSRLGLATTVGSPYDRHVLEVLDGSDALLNSIIDGLHDEYANAGAAKIDYAVPSLRNLVGTPPDREIDAYVLLVERLRSISAVARDLPQTIELACFEALLGGSEWRQRCFDHLFTLEHANLLAASIDTLSVLAGPSVAETLRSTLDLDFTRVAPAVPDRQSPAPLEGGA